MTHTLHYTIHQVAGYINWLYFFHTWGFPARCADNPEAMRLQEEARQMLLRLDEAGYQTHFRVALMTCNSRGEDILLENGGVLPLLRQQHAPEGEPCLCLADFIRPVESGIPDRIGLFASTVDAQIEHLYPNDDYQHLLVQTLADRLAEATAELGHQQVRTTLWGYAPDEHLTPEELFREAYQGKRPAVGYPSMPDQSVNFLLSEWLDFPSLGIQLTENGAMRPHASTSGLILSHPAARHFSIGRIGEDQLQDYARRRNLPPDYLRKFLLT